MRTKPTNDSLDRLFESLGECLDVETSRRIVKLKADAELQARIDALADKCSGGSLSESERSEYEAYVHFGTFIALLKSKARRRLAETTPL